MKITRPVFILILAITIFGLYWRSLNYPLIWDDKVLFENNPFFTENKPLSSSLTTGYFRQQIGLQNVDFYYRPVLMLTFMLENKLWGIHSFSLRLINLIIFFLALIGWYLFFKARFDTSAFPEILLILFALFPLHVDNIVWIVGRGDLLLLLFSGLCFLCLERYAQKKRNSFLFLASLFFALGVFSKEAFLFFFPILLLLEYQLRKKINPYFHGANALISVSYFLIKGPVLGLRNLPLAWPFNPGVILSTLLGTVGYYARSVVFPFSGRRFLPASDLISPAYIFWGVLALIALTLVFLLRRRKAPVVVPASLILVFLLGHALLAFSQLFPYRAYSRYMIIPALGFLWLLTQEIIRLKERPRSGLAFVLLILFISRIVFSTRDYRHEIIFWQKAVTTAPADTYARFQLASSFFREKDFVDAELVLNETLFLKMPREVALLVSLLYADIDSVRADYDHIFRWMESIEALARQSGGELAPFMRFFVNHKNALTYLSLGQAEEAEKLFLTNITTFPGVRETYLELYSLYLGREEWEKARQLETNMKKQFPRSFASLNTDRLKETLENSSTEQKILFYEKYKNYPQAIALLESQGNPADLTPENLFLLARLWVKSGQTPKAQEIIAAWLQKNQPTPDLLNKIGLFYLNEFFRVKEALAYFQQSLELDKNQMEIRYIIMRLTDTYLQRLRPVWPEEGKN